jgi:hypothetical protein
MTAAISMSGSSAAPAQAQNFKTGTECLQICDKEYEACHARSLAASSAPGSRWFDKMNQLEAACQRNKKKDCLPICDMPPWRNR